MRASSSRARAFSLLEMITALAVSAVLVGAMGVSLITASSAMERGVGAAASDRAAGEALAMLQADLGAAKAFYERTPTSVWFGVPDRDGDGKDEHIRYAWSGKVGDPLVRSTNGGPAGVVAADIQELDFGFDQLPGHTRTTSAERLLASFTSQAGASTMGTTITGTVWGAEILRPSFTADVVEWKVTSVRIPMRTSGIVDATANISIREVGADNLPTARIYAQAEVKESALTSTFLEKRITFASCEAIAPGAPVAIVVRGVSGAAAPCMVQYQSTSTPIMPFNMWRCASSNSGSSWTAFQQTQNLMFELYGTVTTEGY